MEICVCTPTGTRCAAIRALIRSSPHWRRKNDLKALVTETQRDVTGVVRLKLYKGNIHRRRPQKPEEPLRSKNRDDGRRRIIVRSKRRHWLHSAERA